MGDRSGKCLVQPFNMNGNAERVKGNVLAAGLSGQTSQQLSKILST